jgi:ElaB/YqjD/DUF883 family membrane-anchored ribosome-binding protein
MATQNPYGAPRSLPRQDSGSTLGHPMENVQDVASSAASAVGHVKDRVGEMASEVAHRASDAWDSTRQGVASAASTVADGAEQAYDSVNGMIRRYPLPAVLVAFGVGFLLAQAIQMSRRD